VEPPSLLSVLCDLLFNPRGMAQQKHAKIAKKVGDHPRLPATASKQRFLHSVSSASDPNAIVTSVPIRGHPPNPRSSASHSIVHSQRTPRPPRHGGRAAVHAFRHSSFLIRTSSFPALPIPSSVVCALCGKSLPRPQFRAQKPPLTRRHNTCTSVTVRHSRASSCSLTIRTNRRPANASPSDARG
jgi:hypothetical protein